MADFLHSIVVIHINVDIVHWIVVRKVVDVNVATDHQQGRVCILLQVHCSIRVDSEVLGVSSKQSE